MSVLINVIFPVILIISVGAAVQRYLQLEVRTLSRAIFYLFTPSLVFDSLVRSRVSGAEFGQITIVYILTTLILWGLGEIAARLLRLDGTTRSAFLLAMMFMNTGNYGLSVTLFAFGEAALARATVYFTVSAVVIASLGVYIAARGRASSLIALRRVVKVPMVYAAVLGLGINFCNLTIPEPLMKSVHLLGQASVPAALVMLGIQLLETFQNDKRVLHIPALTIVTVGRLIIAPVLAVFLIASMDMSNAARNAVIVESAMPTAVTTTILATEFESDAEFVALSVLITTIVSVLTVTVLLNWIA